MIAVENDKKLNIEEQYKNIVMNTMEDRSNRLISNHYLHQNNYYKRYANILWNDLSSIIKFLTNNKKCI